MALAREYRETVTERLRADREFTAAVLAEAIRAFIEGDKATALSTLIHTIEKDLNLHLEVKAK